MKDNTRKAARQYYSIGEIYARKEEFESAESNFREALSNFKKEQTDGRDIASALMGLSEVLVKREKYKEAIDKLLNQSSYIKTLKRVYLWLWYIPI